MEWPSKNIIHGGVLHPAKANYSSETHKFLKVLMDETKLSNQLRRNIDYHLRNGEPLSLPTSRSSDQIFTKKKVPTVVVRPGSSKRRSRETIVKSGVYEREKYVRREPLIDREKEKLRLINKLAFGKNIEPKPPKINVVKEPKNHVKLNRFDQLQREIKEREQWLDDMEKLGEGKQHRFNTKQEIQSRVREMEQLNLADII